MIMINLLTKKSWIIKKNEFQIFLEKSTEADLTISNWKNDFQEYSLSNPNTMRNLFSNQKILNKKK